MAPSDKSNDFFELKVELAIVKKDIEQLKKDVDEIKEEISDIKGWAMKAFWIIAGAVILQATTFILNGGLNVFK
jgi:hypothetical protein